jgi:carbon-monoxide dehydrogenase large subunit
MNAPQIGAARFIGQRVPRKEDGRLLTGHGTFVDDVVLPGMLHVAFVRSPIARGKIRSIESTVARDMPGVVAILTAQDLSRFKIDMLSFYLTTAEIAIPPLATDHVAYVGDPVVMVIAKDRYLAEDAAGLVVIDYEEEDPVVTIDDAKNGKLVHPGTESNAAATMGEEEDEDLEALLANAPHLVTGMITHQRISQSPMETRGIVVTKQGEDELTVYLACQGPHLAARYLTQAFGIPQINIRVIAKDVGGAFGLKVQPWREEVAVVAAGMILGRPLKWIEDRLENLTAANQAREQEITLRIAFDAEGKLLGSHADYGMNNGAYPHAADCNIAVHMFLWSAYKMPHYSFYTRGWYSNTVGLAAYRGPWAMESLARETMLDIAARQIGIDPIELRRRNLITKADQPCTTGLGVQLDDITPAECLDTLLGTLDIAAFRAEQAAARKEGRYLGLGIACYIEPTGSAGSIGVMSGELAQVRIEPNGKVTAMLSTHSQGHGTETTMAQVIADQLGVAYDDVNVFQGDSSRGGFGPGAAGSRQGVLAGGACTKAAGLLAEKVKRLAAHLLNANLETISIENGLVHVAGAAEMTRSLREIAEIAYGEPGRLPPGFEAGLEAQYRYTPPPITFTSAANACIVEVDTETGFVKIKRWISCEDCGVVINPAVVEGQIAGGLAQAIGTVLLEEVGYDHRGNPTTVTYKDYMLPAISDVPDFEFVHFATPSQSEGGFRGAGEGGAIIGPPTLVNAIADALSPFNARCLDLPLTPSKILELIDGREISRAERRQAAAAARAETAPPVAATAAEPAASTFAGGTDIVSGGIAKEIPAEAPQPPARAAASVIDGMWKLTISAPMGSQTIKGRFDTQGSVLSGMLYSDQGDQAFAGTVAGDTLKWEMKITKPMSMTLKYEVKVEGDKMTGKCKMGFFGTAKLAGERL